MELKREKYVDLIMYIICKYCNNPSFGKTVLCSLLYFIDFNYYENYNELLTNETYIKSKKGIKPKHFSEVSEDLIARKQIYLKKEPYYNRTIHRYLLTTIPINQFKSKELEIIDLSIKKLYNENATSITNYAKKDPPINIANFGEEINSKHVFSRNSEYSVKKNKQVYKI